MPGDAAGHDAVVVGEVGLDVDRQAVERHPVADAHADGGDLVLARAAVEQRRLVGPRHPDADPAGAALGGDREAGQRPDRPFLEVGDEAPHVLAARPEVEHDVDHPLAGAVVGVLAAAAGDVDREAHRLQQVLLPGAGPGRVQGRVFQQPDQFAGAAGPDVGDPRLHLGQGVGVGDRGLRNAPFGLVHCGKIGAGGLRRKGRRFAPRRGADLPCHCGAYLVSPAASTGAAMAELVDALA